MRRTMAPKSSPLWMKSTAPFSLATAGCRGVVSAPTPVRSLGGRAAAAVLDAVQVGECRMHRSEAGVFSFGGAACARAGRGPARLGREYPCVPGHGVAGRPVVADD